jgi:hypothetical protein
MGDKKRKILLTFCIVGALGSVAAFGTYSAFTGTTTNSGNSFAAGTVSIQDDSGQVTALFNNVTNQAPSATTQRCIRVKYTGSLASTVHMFIPSTSNGSQFQVTVDRGSGMTASDLTNRTCSGFTPASTAFPLDDLANFPSAYSPSGVAGKAGDAAWAQNDAVDFRITLQPKDDTTANAHTSAVSTGSFSITWEAHSN